MSKKSRFRGCLYKQYGKRAQALLNSASQHLYHIHWSLARKLSWKKSLLLTCKILQLLVSTLATNDKCPNLIRDNLTIPIQVQLSHNHKWFSQFFAAFLKSRINFQHFEKKDNPHSFCISQITDCELPKKSKNTRFRGPFDKQHGKCSQGLLKSGSQHLYQIHCSRPRKLSWKKSLLLKCKILVLLINRLAADEKYPVLNKDNLTIPIQMQLSKQQKTFSQLFLAFWKSSSNFKHFQQKDGCHRFCISEISDFKNVVISMSKNSRFRGPFDKQHGKRYRSLLKCGSQHLFHIYWSLSSQLSWKKSLLLTCEMLALLVNTLAADEKYPVFNRDNLTIPIQMRLSQKQNTFSQFKAAFLKSRLNFKYFEKKDDPDRFCFSEFMDSENVVR